MTYLPFLDFVVDVVVVVLEVGEIVTLVAWLPEKVPTSQKSQANTLSNIHSIYS